jgi:endo-1,4-beta-mannosidase
MRTVPTFLVGHMSGQNWDPPWRGDRDLYTDVRLVERQAWFIEQVVARFHTHPAITGWLISNEMPIYGGAAPQQTVTAWARLMVQAVRAGGGRQPVSIGDGAWGVEVTGEDNGYSVRALAAFTDFVGPHVYRMETDAVRQFLKAGFVCELAAVGRRPVVLEEFGVSSAFTSDENAAHYYRQALHRSLLGGATGWLAWNNTDFDLVTQDPYRHHAFELSFGLTTADGTPKPALGELRSFAGVLERLELDRCARWPAAAALVVGEHVESPHVPAEDRTFTVRALEQAHVAAREADLPIAFLRERDGIEAGAKLYLVPSAKQLTAPGWLRLRELAAGGATVYVSYAVGDGPFQRGPWWIDTEELFGVRHTLAYGLVEPIDDDIVEFTFDVRLGSLHGGDTLTFRVAGNDNVRSYLPVEPTEGRVIARDGHGRPAIVRKDHGAGAMVLCTYPVEALAAARGRVNPEDTWRLYDALAEHAGVERPLQVADPRVTVDGLVRDDGRQFAWLASLAGEAVDITVPKPLIDLDTGTTTTRLTLPPYGVQVFEISDPHGAAQ